MKDCCMLTPSWFFFFFFLIFTCVSSAIDFYWRLYIPLAGFTRDDSFDGHDMVICFLCIGWLRRGIVLGEEMRKENWGYYLVCCIEYRWIICILQLVWCCDYDKCGRRVR